jgi:hypothetical protein
MGFRDIDFRPIAESGWRALFVLEEGDHDVSPLAGWLVQEGWDHDRDEPIDGTKPADRYRRIIAAVASGDHDGSVEAVDAWEENMDFKSFVRLLLPGEPEPDAEAIGKIHARHIEDRDRKVAHRRELAAKDAPKVLASLSRSEAGFGAALAGLSTGRTSEALLLLAEQGQAVYDRDANRWRVMTSPGGPAQA